MKKETFSKRLGHSTNSTKEITIREDAPEGLRGFVIMSFYDLNKKPSELRQIICRVLRIPPDSSNWSEYPNIDYEVKQLLGECEWFSVYDIIERIIQRLNPTEKKIFIDDLNEYFKNNGIGWQIMGELIQTRGDEVFETAIKKVETALERSNLPTARNEIREAISDLSRRPEPDITGAIQHSLACLECVTREFLGDKKATLGDLMKKYPGAIPSPLDQAITKIWSFTSEQGRHLKEGRAPEFQEAELIVELTSALANYMSKKLNKADSTNEDFHF